MLYRVLSDIGGACLSGEMQSCERLIDVHRYNITDIAGMTHVDFPVVSACIASLKHHLFLNHFMLLFTSLAASI